MQIKIGTRGSMLALAQTNLIKDALERSDKNISVTLVEIKTQGDKKQGTAAASHGDKKDWILELELAVLSGEIDLAVHSGKDVPADTEKGTELEPVLARESPFDVFIGKKKADGSRWKWAELAKGAVVGTASLRRQASALLLRPDIKVVEHRGNVPTRLRKLDEIPALDGIILAEAGIKRLNLSEVRYEVFDPTQVMPAVNQGIMSVQYRSDRDDLRKVAARLIDLPTQAAWRSERSCVELLQADCKSAVSIFAQTSGNKVSLSARVMMSDGSKVIEELNQTAEFSKASQLGLDTANKLLARGAAKIIEECHLIAKNAG